MPVVGEFHDKFWAVTDTAVPPPLQAGKGGYPLWQASVVASSLPFGPFGAWWDTVRARVRWWWTLLMGVKGLSFNHRADVKAYVSRLASGQSPNTVQVVERVIDRVIEKPVEVIREVPKKIIERQIVPASDVDRRIAALDTERQAVLTKTLGWLESPHYETAQTAVRQTATTLGFDRPEAWKDLTRHMKEDLGRTQNVYRHLKAMRLLRDAATSTLSNPDANLLTELAYTGFAAMGH